MSVAVDQPARPRIAPWALGGALLGGALAVAQALLPRDAPAAPWLLAVPALLAASALAVIDARTRLLPNRHVAALAAGAAVVVLSLALRMGEPGPVLVALLVAAVAAAAYLGMGLAGWVGFGDAKFAGALALAIAPLCGMGALWLAPLAVVLGGVQRLANPRQRGARPHGPAIAAAGGALLVLALLQR